jgi:phosphoribosyl 1,2-cyclic phosphodiesterase
MGALRFISLGSGSSGNCYYLGTEHYGILIDAGLSQRRILKRLKEVNIQFCQIYGIVLTHGHADHVRGANSISKNIRTPFYATTQTFALVSTGYRSQFDIEHAVQNCIEPFCPFEIGEFKITAFPLSHDVPNVGFKIEFRNKIFTIATDLGEATEYLCKTISESDYLVLESNYDIDMLEQGSYPFMLKQRIVSTKGHLSNAMAAELIAKYATPKLKRLFLCHLSAHNNTAQLAEEAVKPCIPANTILMVLPRLTPTLLMEL